MNNLNAVEMYHLKGKIWIEALDASHVRMLDAMDAAHKANAELEAAREAYDAIYRNSPSSSPSPFIR